MARRLALVIAGVAVLGGCGSGPAENRPAAAPATAAPGTQAPAPATQAPAPARAASVLPRVTVVDVVSGAQVELPSLAPSRFPTLLWFYAPH